jgi:hypothetical protein
VTLRDGTWLPERRYLVRIDIDLLPIRPVELDQVKGYDDREDHLQNSKAQHVTPVITSVLAVTDSDTSNQTCVPLVRLVAMPLVLNGTKAPELALVPVIPTAKTVPVGAAALAGAAPVPSRNVTVLEAIALLFIVPSIVK